MVSITIENLTKRFGGVVALDAVSLRIEPGEIFFLLGPSGCGKTTLLRNIAGFYTPEEGRVLFDEDDVTTLPPHRRNTGMMFQSYALWPHMTVASNVAFGLEERKLPKSEIRQRVAEALASVQMEKYADRKINQLSGGQQQRVALARALVIRPRALLLDEPLSNLDAKLRLEMRGEIRRVCREFGLTAIYVTHDQKEALSISDRMAVLDAGRVAQVGTPTEIYRRPASRLVAHFIGETNFIDGEVVAPTSLAPEGNDTAEGMPGLLVRTPLGDFVGTPTTGLIASPGDHVTLSIRPECWRFSDKKSHCNTLTGCITSETYLGEVAQYEVACESHAIKVFELNPRGIRTKSPEQTVAHLVASPTDVVILPR